MGLVPSGPVPGIAAPRCACCCACCCACRWPSCCGAGEVRADKGSGPLDPSSACPVCFFKMDRRRSLKICEYVWGGPGGGGEGGNVSFLAHC
jgi:hypothetical protein